MDEHNFEITFPCNQKCIDTSLTPLSSKKKREKREKKRDSYINWTLKKATKGIEKQRRDIIGNAGVN